MPTSKNKISNILPKQAKQAIRPVYAFLDLLPNYVYDLRRFVQYSALGNVNTRIKHAALITKEYHRIEKRLAFKQPRIQFGPEIIEKLLQELRKYIDLYGTDEIVSAALDSLMAYYNYNLCHGIDDKNLYNRINEIGKHILLSEDRDSKGGVTLISRKSIQDLKNFDFKKFCELRYSIRNFSHEEVDISLIKSAVEIAQKSPSVCNRQSAKVYAFSSIESRKRVLSYQNGNRGFGDQANKVLLVTSDLGHFFSPGERNQCWIDGGLFAMSLVYALHSLGLGTCCLNWSVQAEKDSAMRKAVGISDSEAVIMMIAVGHLPEELNVAWSARKKLEDVLVLKE